MSLKRNEQGFTHWILPLIVIVLISFVGVRLLIASHAATPGHVPIIANVGTSSNGVPVPTTGAYFGGINNSSHDGVSYSYQGNGCSTLKDEDQLECKIGLSAKQQSVLSSSAYVGTSSHIFDKCSNGNGGYSSGYIKAAASKPGHKMLFINMKCGSDWLGLATAASNSTLINSIRAKVDAIGTLKNSSGKPMPVVLTFWHEPENDSCDVNAKTGAVTNGSGTPEAYRAAFRRFVSIARAEEAAKGITNISSGFILMGFTFDNYPGKETTANVFPAGGGCVQNGKHLTKASAMMRNPENWWPGDDAVDWINADPYDMGGNRTFSSIVGTPSSPSFYQWATSACPAAKLQPTTNYNCTSARQSKPLALTEFGTTGSATYRKNWFLDAAAHVSNYPAMKGYAYWSDQVASNTPDFIVDHPGSDPTHASLAAFTKFALATPFTSGLSFTGGTGGTDNPPTVSLTAPSANSTVVKSTKVTVTATALDDHGITDVTLSYKLSSSSSWTNLVSKSNAPFTAVLDTSNLASGTYQIRAVASDNHQPAQTATATTNLTVTPVLPPQQQPDLIVTNLWAAPNTPTAGQGVTFNVRVLNQGGGAVPVGKYIGVAFTVDGVKQTWSGYFTSGLAAGANETLNANNGIAGTATWLSTAGAHTVQAQVNDLNYISESNTSNNFMQIPLTVNRK